MRRTAFSACLVALVSIAAGAALVMAGSDAPPPGEPGELVYVRGSVTWRLQPSPCKANDLEDALRSRDVRDVTYSAVVEQERGEGPQRWAACWGYDYEMDIVVADRRSEEPGFMPREWFTKR